MLFAILRPSPETKHKKMTFKLMRISSEKMVLIDSLYTNKFNDLVIRPLIIILMASPIFYYLDIYKPSYQLHCNRNHAGIATDCYLKTTYYYVLPIFTKLGIIEEAYFISTPHHRFTSMGSRKKPCANIELSINSESNPLILGKRTKKSIIISCLSRDELPAIINQINDFIKDKQNTTLDIVPFSRVIQWYIVHFILLLGHGTTISILK